jgi:hypothetical protein
MTRDTPNSNLGHSQPVPTGQRTRRSAVGSEGPKKFQLSCHYCGMRPGTTNDHIVPRVLGGPGSFWNYVAACSPCNSAKTDLWPTCECEKCSAAVRRFMENPAWVRKAKRVLARRRDTVQHNIDMIEKIRLRELRRQRDGLQDRIDHIRDLELTLSQGSSIVET